MNFKKSNHFKKNFLCPTTWEKDQQNRRLNNSDA